MTAWAREGAFSMMVLGCYSYSALLGAFMNQRLMGSVQVGGLVVGSVIGLTAADPGGIPSPPVAKKVPHVTEVNGHKMEDNYFWLRDKPNPEVRACLGAENGYSEAGRNQ